MHEFVRDGGYRDRRYWTDAGWGWRAFRNAKCPVFWTAVGPDGLHQYRLRTTFETTPMPWSWPAEVRTGPRVRVTRMQWPCSMHAQVNYHEAKAYCAWAAERDNATYRIPTEAEHIRLREAAGGGGGGVGGGECDPAAAGARDTVMGMRGVEHGARANLNLAFSSPSPVDAYPVADGSPSDPMGSVWEWCEDDFHPLPGFKVRPPAGQCPSAHLGASRQCISAGAPAV